MDLSYDIEELFKEAHSKLSAVDRLDLWMDAVCEIEECEGECDLSAIIENLCVNNPEKISFKVYKARDKNAPRNH
jgi:hypothetical protein